MVRERFGNEPIKSNFPPKDFPQPDDSLLEKTFFTEIIKRPRLRASLWPEETFDDFTQTVPPPRAAS